MSGFTFKCVQLDLARQIETVDFITDFIDLAADCGYNSVLLYLEDRIRTRSYHLQDEGEAYSPEDIGKIVSHAAGRGIDLIPCVATLGHAERFLAHPELEHLAECRNGLKNRFGGQSKDVFCITDPEFYPFIETYLEEVATLFPSRYFHIGLDEFFSFNLCERCRKQMPELRDEEKFFLNHIVRISRFLNRLGKRPMMWSDMFEIYTHVLPDIPKDVIVVDWQYQEDVRFYLGHLFEEGVEDRKALNDKLGLDTVIASAEGDTANALSALHFAERRSAWGFLVTSWEKSDTYLYRSFPIICHAGFQMQGKSEKEAWQATMEYLFGTRDPLLSSAVRLICADCGLLHFLEVSENTLFMRPFLGIGLNSHERIEVMEEMLLSARDLVRKDIGRKIWKDLWNKLEEKRIAAELKTACWDMFDFGFCREYSDRAQAAAMRFRALLESKEKDWEEFRPGIRNNVFTARKNDLCERLQRNLSGFGRDSFIRIRFCMPDYYVINTIQADVLCDGKWIEAVPANGSKGGEDICFERAWFFRHAGIPEAVRLTVSGMGGRGISYVEIHDPQGEIYIPESITEVSGIVEHPGHLLENDGKFAWFNTQCTRHNFHDLNTAKAKHAVTLKLKRHCL